MKVDKIVVKFSFMKTNRRIQEFWTHIQLNDHRVLLYVIKADVILHYPMFEALLYVKKMGCGSPVQCCTRLNESLVPKTLVPDFHSTLYGVVRSPAATN